MTHLGEKLHFRAKSVNKRESNLAQAERFPSYKYYQEKNGVSCFLGPGSYNDHEDYLKIAQNPCSIKMVCILDHELFLEENNSFTRKRQWKLLLYNAAIKKRSVSTMKQRISSGQFHQQTDSSDRGDPVPIFANSFNQSQVYFNEAGSNERALVNTFSDNQRPQTSYQDKKRSILPNGKWSMSLSTKASMSGKLGQDHGGTTIGQFSQTSNFDRTTLEPNSALNLDQINEEGQQAYRTNNHTVNGDQSLLSKENEVRIKSMLPKTAMSFHKMKKGLYLNPVKGFPYNMKEEALARSFNILSAYGEILPQISNLQKRTKSKGSKKQKAKRNLINDFSTMSPEPNYMNVIRDSPQVVMQREDLEKQKRDILNMHFDNSDRKKVSNRELNKFINERQSDYSQIEEDIQGQNSSSKKT